MLISLLVTLLIMALVYYCVTLVLGLLPLPGNIKQAIQIVVAIIFLIYLIQLLLGVGTIGVGGYGRPLL